jgi:hypothetical protein
LLILSWILFVGVCIEAGGSIFSAFYTLVINPVNAADFWVGNDLSGLYKYDPGYFLVVALLTGIASVMKAFIFYFTTKILQGKNLDLSQPFSKEVRAFINKLTFLAFATGLFTSWGARYTEWLVRQGVKMPDTQHLRLGGGDVWLFMAVILYIIAQIFKRGIEIQTENDLTI